MGRVEFMRELSYLLQDLDVTDAEEALRYYNDYFEDAGPENEEQVVRELGSPEKVAAIIKDGLEGNSREKGSYTDTGYTDERFDENRMPDLYSRKESGKREKEYNEQNPFQYKTDTPEGKRNPWKIIAIIAICLIALPILGPVAVALAAVVLLLLLAAVVVVLAVAVSGIAIVISGVIAFVGGIAKITLGPAVGILICGAALLLIAVGILVTWLVGKLFFKVVPPALNGLIRFLRRPFERRGEAV